MSVLSISEWENIHIKRLFGTPMKFDSLSMLTIYSRVYNAIINIKLQRLILYIIAEREAVVLS
jgi:hypothetical protein